MLLNHPRYPVKTAALARPFNGDNFMYRGYCSQMTRQLIAHPAWWWDARLDWVLLYAITSGDVDMAERIVALLRDDWETHKHMLIPILECIDAAVTPGLVDPLPRLIELCFRDSGEPHWKIALETIKACIGNGDTGLASARAVLAIPSVVGLAGLARSLATLAVHCRNSTCSEQLAELLLRDQRADSRAAWSAALLDVSLDSDETAHPFDHAPSPRQGAEELID